MTGFFDLSNPLLKADPYALYRQYQANGPVQCGQSAMPGYQNTWYFLGFEEARLLLRSDLHNPIYRRKITTGVTGDNNWHEARDLIWQHLSEWLLFQSPPLHTERRALIANAFKKPSLNQFRFSIKDTAKRLLEKALSKNTIEIQQEFSYPLAVTAVTGMLGLPPPDIAWFKGITRKIANTLDVGYTPATYNSGLIALNELIAYIEDAIVWKRKHFSNDLLSHLICELDRSPSVENNSVVTLISQILFAGQETVADGIGNGVNVLVAYPDQRRLMREDARLLENATQEIQRFDTSVQFTSPRMITSDMRFGNVKITAGETVVIVLGACNRDNRHFPNPDQFDVKRNLSGPELTYGHGIHYCLGVHLARMVMQVAFEELLSGLPENWTLSSPVSWRDNALFRGPDSLILSFNS